MPENSDKIIIIIFVVRDNSNIGKSISEHLIFQGFYFVFKSKPPISTCVNLQDQLF